jgi:hypothetical protein
MTGAPSVSEDPGATAAPTPYEAPLDLATTLSRPRQYVKAVLRLLVQRWDPFVRPTEDEKTGDLRFTKVPVEEANARLLQVVVRYLKLHGEFFLAPGPHYLDGRKKAIYRLHPKTAFPVLFPLGFRATGTLLPHARGQPLRAHYAWRVPAAEGTPHLIHES